MWSAQGDEAGHWQMEFLLDWLPLRHYPKC